MLQRPLHRLRRVVHYPETQVGPVVPDRDEHGLIGPLHRIEGGLAPPVVVDHRPGDSGPAVVEHPEETPGTSELAATEVLNGGAQPLGLQDLLQQHPAAESQALCILPAEQGEAGLLHLPGVPVRVELPSPAAGTDPVLLQAGAQALDRGRGEHPILAREPSAHALVPAKVGPLLQGGRRDAHLPGVLVPLGRTVRVGRVPEGARRVVGTVRIEAPAHFGQHLMVDRLPVEALRLGPPAEAVPHVALVVAAPERYAGMISQAAHHGLGLLPGLVHEGGIVVRVEGARVHKVLPDHDPVGVAQVVEGLVLVDAATPDAEHIEMGVRGRADELLVALLVDAGEDRVGRDPVGSHGEHPGPVDLEGEGPALLRRLQRVLEQADPGEPGLGHPVVEDVLPFDQVDHHGVEVRLARRPRVPEQGPVDPDRTLHSVQARIDLRLEALDELLLGRQDDLELHTAGPVEKALHLDRDLKLRAPGRAAPRTTASFGLDGRAHPDVLDRGPLVDLQGRGSPDTAREEPGGPVPAEGKLGLAQQARRAGQIPPPHIFRGLLPPGLARPALQAHSQEVLVRAKPSAHIDAARHESITMLADLLPVEKDLGLVIEPLKDQLRREAGALGRHVECPAPPPLPVLDPSTALRVQSRKGLLKPARPDQVEVHIARNEDLHGASRLKLPEVCAALLSLAGPQSIQRPFAVQ